MQFIANLADFLNALPDLQKFADNRRERRDRTETGSERDRRDRRCQTLQLHILRLARNSLAYVLNKTADKFELLRKFSEMVANNSRGITKDRSASPGARGVWVILNASRP